MGICIELSAHLICASHWFLIRHEGLRQFSAVDTGEKEQKDITYVSFGFHSGQELVAL